MGEREVSTSSTTEGLPISPSLGPALAAEHVAARTSGIDRRTVFVCALAVGIALAAGLVAQLLVWLIGLCTNIAFYGSFTSSARGPAGHHLGPFVVLVPVLGGLIVGVMARYGSAAIRGHGIPEAMERVLQHKSQIPARVMFLKPLSAAVSIGTGGPFGAEGPIIATGGAFGSFVGQVIRTTASERKALLAAGAAAGMAATFGSPVAAVLLAVELLLFELSPRSVIPVALAAATAAGVRVAAVGTAPVFPMPALLAPSGAALATYIALGAFMGVAAVLVTRMVYAVEDAFEKLPIHWMWWPALGGLAVGIVGYFAPHTMGVGYDNIEHIVSGELVGRALLILFLLKFVSWVIALGSGTSGGTLAPLFTIGGGLGAVVGELLAHFAPQLGVDARVAGLVGMAAMFAGSSRAMLASVVFAFETTRQPMGLLPLLGGCAAAYLISCLMMRHSIMTVKIARRGVHVPSEYGPDALEGIRVGECATSDVVALDADDTVAEVREWLDSGAEGAGHRGFPVVDGSGSLVGVLTRGDIAGLAAGDERQLRALIVRAPVVVPEDFSLREAAECMAQEQVSLLPVVSQKDRRKVVGLLTAKDLLVAYRRKLDDDRNAERVLSLRVVRFGRSKSRLAPR